MTLAEIVRCPACGFEMAPDRIDTRRVECRACRRPFDITEVNT